MEKRVLGINWRLCVALIAISFTAIAVNAQLTNPGFETAGTNYTWPDAGDGAFAIISNIFATGWSVNSGYAARTLTNAPAQGTYEDAATGTDSPGINQSGTTNTAHSGGASLRVMGPFPAVCCAGSGAVQLKTGASVTNNTRWVATGFGMNWSGDPMQSLVIGSVGFGLMQIAFYDGTNGLIGTPIDGLHITNGTPVDTWISCVVTADAPPGTVSVGVWGLHVGMAGAVGSIFWDDMTLTNIGTAPPPPPIITNDFQVVIQAGNQLCWTSVVTASYQPQASDDGSTWTNIGSLLPGDGNVNCAFGTSHKFYRVLQSQ